MDGQNRHGTTCPEAVLKKSGIYRNERKHDFSGIVLLTASNSGYDDMLFNWEFLADRLGLKWVVASLDEDLHQKLGLERSFVTNSSFSVGQVTKFRQKGFNKLTCNKLRMVLQVLEDCEMDVVFSDTDNVFMKDPFSHDFGELMQHGTYEYIYQVNSNKANSSAPRSHIELEEGAHASTVKEGNTGFHFLSHKSKMLKEVISSTLDQCDAPRNNMDDQRIFWNILRSGEIPFRMCRHPQPGSEWVYNSLALERKQSHNDNILSLCFLDPYFYRVGLPHPNKTMQNDMVTYHANHIVGKEKKIKRLIRYTPNGIGWNTSRWNVSLNGI